MTKLNQITNNFDEKFAECGGMVFRMANGEKWGEAIQSCLNLCLYKVITGSGNRCHKKCSTSLFSNDI